MPSRQRKRAVPVRRVAPGDRDRAADTDLNPDTDPDSAWLPLITTPPYPAYAGNLATIEPARRALQLVCGTDDVPVAVTWSLPGGLPGVTRHFDGFWQAAEEEAMARIYGGIHYRFISRPVSRSASRPRTLCSPTSCGRALDGSTEGLGGLTPRWRPEAWVHLSLARIWFRAHPPWRDTVVRSSGHTTPGESGCLFLARR